MLACGAALQELQEGVLQLVAGQLLSELASGACGLVPRVPGDWRGSHAFLELFSLMAPLQVATACKCRIHSLCTWQHCLV